MAYVDRNTLRMSDDEAWEYLARTRWGRIGTVSGDGEPHVTPIGFHVHERRVYFHALIKSRRTRNIGDEPRVSLCVDSGVAPGEGYDDRRGVVVSGRCRRLDAEADAALLDGVRRGFADEFFGDESTDFERRTHAWFEIDPYRIASWDFGRIPQGADRMAPPS